jgi:hypothetical protein
MSTLTEIETVVERLPLAEQEELLRHLEAKLRRGSTTASASREDWMRRLQSLRASIGSGTSTLTGEQILVDLRED